MKTLKVPAVAGLLAYSGPSNASPTLRRVAAILPLILPLIFLAPISLPAFAAASCTFSTAGSVAFAAYDVFTTTANTSGVGSLKVKCTGGAGNSYVVSLSTGQSNNYTTRFMKNGTFDLDYNLYTSSALTTIWGNGTSGSGTMSVTGNGTTTLSVYGEIPAGQDVPVGTNYTDSITATVTF